MKQVFRSVRTLILSLIEWVSPSLRQRLGEHASRRAWSLHEVQVLPVLKKLTSTAGWVVQAGPFQGMRYVQQSRGSVLIPKLLGCYERELADSLRVLVDRKPDAIVDVGCAEGYYAVGMSMLVPSAVVFAFDIDPESQRLCKALAALNGSSDRVQVNGACDTGILQSILEQHRRNLVISDCEGYEEVLLDPKMVPTLRRADLLVELHEFVKPGVTHLLTERFHATHRILRIPAVPIDADGIVALKAYEPALRRQCTSEFRPDGMEWLVCLALEADHAAA